MTLLQKSIKHWEDNLEKLKAGAISAHAVYGDQCQLCEVYLDPDETCVGCPVAEDTGKPMCEGSPWWQAHGAFGDWLYEREFPCPDGGAKEQSFKDKAIAAFQAEIDYLKQLANKETSDA